MTNRTATRAASAAALALFAALGLSACGGDADGSSGSSGVGSDGPSGLYIQRDDPTDFDDASDVLTIDDGQVRLVEYRGNHSGNQSSAEQCNAYKKFVSLAEKNEFDPEGVDDLYYVMKSGNLNEAGDTIIWEKGDPDQLSVDTPDTGQITIDDDMFVPHSSDQGKKSIMNTEKDECSQS